MHMSCSKKSCVYGIEILIKFLSYRVERECRPVSARFAAYAGTRFFHPFESLYLWEVDAAMGVSFMQYLCLIRCEPL